MPQPVALVESFSDPRAAWCVCYIRPHICHKEIHARFTETELARQFNTPEAIRADARMEGFLAWIAKRPPGFLSRVPGGHRKR
jgi:hypothetical protein